MERLAVREEMNTPQLWAEKVLQSGHDLDIETGGGKGAIYMPRVDLRTLKIILTATQRNTSKQFLIMIQHINENWSECSAAKRLR